MKLLKSKAQEKKLQEAQAILDKIKLGFTYTDKGVTDAEWKTAFRFRKLDLKSRHIECDVCSYPELVDTNSG